MRFIGIAGSMKPMAGPAGAGATHDLPPERAVINAEEPSIRPRLSCLSETGPIAVSHDASGLGLPHASRLRVPTPVPQHGVAVQRATKGKKRAEKRRQERHDAALDRLNRGDPDAYEHLDPDVAQGLRELDANQPRKTAVRLNLETRPQRLAEARIPSILEVGAGTGSGSAHLRDVVLKRRPDLKGKASYLATDISKVGGKGNFLSDPEAAAASVSERRPKRPKGMSKAEYRLHLQQARAQASKSWFGVRGGINANKLEDHFPDHSIEEIIGANAYGNLGVPGASYGLVRDTAEGGTERDDRFLRSAHKVLKPGGSVRLLARSNFLAKEQNQSRAFHLKKTNKYLEPESEDLKDTVNLNYDVTARPIEQPEDVHFYRPDTNPGTRKELGEYNTEFEFHRRGNPGTFQIGPELSQSSSSEAEEDSSDNDEERSSGSRDSGESSDDEIARLGGVPRFF